MIANKFVVNKCNKGLFIVHLNQGIHHCPFMLQSIIQIEDPSLYYDIHATRDPLLFTL